MPTGSQPQLHQDHRIPHLQRLLQHRRILEFLRRRQLHLLCGRSVLRIRKRGGKQHSGRICRQLRRILHAPLIPAVIMKPGRELYGPRRQGLLRSICFIRPGQQRKFHRSPSVRGSLRVFPQPKAVAGQLQGTSPPDHLPLRLLALAIGHGLQCRRLCPQRQRHAILGHKAAGGRIRHGAVRTHAHKKPVPLHDPIQEDKQFRQCLRGRSIVR